MTQPWTPIANPKYLGELPEKPGTISYAVDVDVPPAAKEVLVYTFVTSKVAGPKPQRGYYTFFTTAADGTKYIAYMNVLLDATSANSENIWLPVTPERKIHAELLMVSDTARGKKSKKVAVGTHLADYMRTDDDVESGIFVTGYR